MDIATLLENHRRYLISEVADEFGDEHITSVATSAHDRATTKTLLDLYRTSQGTGHPAGQVTQPAMLMPLTVTSRKVKAGSKKARDRAIKAGETRRRNLADKKAAANGGGVPQDIKDADDALRDGEAHGRDEGGAA